MEHVLEKLSNDKFAKLSEDQMAKISGGRWVLKYANQTLASLNGTSTTGDYYYNDRKGYGRFVANDEVTQSDPSANLG
ncbi:MAG: hypothetical protein H6585_09355 [Flavobacteriales bacterium]|nr:hypothetical protein [Flavobacteriales bacterium]